MDLISVVVPVYNVQKYLEKCVQSIIAQDYKNLEIILVDDGSTDESGKICDSLADRDNRIKVIHKKNGGLSSARNAGIDIATGNYIGFVDSDDFIEKEMYSILMENIKKYDSSISICSFKYVFDNGKEYSNFKVKKEYSFEFFDAIKEMNTFEKFDMSACTKLFDMKLFENIRFPEGKLSEDFYIMYKLFERSRKVSYTTLPLYNYFQRKNSITKSKRINHDFEKAAFEQMKYLEDKYPELKDIVHAAYASANLTVYDFYLKNEVRCPSNTLSLFKRNVKENYLHIKNSKMYGFKKRVQIFLFIYCLPLYKFAFNVYRKIRD